MGIKALWYIIKTAGVCDHAIKWTDSLLLQRQCFFIKLSNHYMQEKKMSWRIESVFHPHSRPIILNDTAVLCGPLCLSATSPQRELQQWSPWSHGRCQRTPGSPVAALNECSWSGSPDEDIRGKKKWPGTVQTSLPNVRFNEQKTNADLRAGWILHVIHYNLHGVWITTKPRHLSCGPPRCYHTGTQRLQTGFQKLHMKVRLHVLR